MNGSPLGPQEENEIDKMLQGHQVTGIRPCAAWTLICWAWEVLDVDKGRRRLWTSGQQRQERGLVGRTRQPATR